MPRRPASPPSRWARDRDRADRDKLGAMRARLLRRPPTRPPLARGRLFGITLGLVVGLVAAGCVAPGGGGSGTGTASGGPAGSASGSSPARPSVIPIIVSSEQAVGPNRFLFSFLDPATNLPAARPERTVSVAFYDAPDATTPVATSDAEFVWGIEGERGLYVAHVTFTHAGTWVAAFTTEAPGSPRETIRVTFDVRERATALGVGDRAPAVRTPTAADVGGDLGRISSDPHPLPAFYETSVDALLAAHRPFVLVFATPAFCVSAQCGPTLERVKPYVAEYPDVAFVNVEPYLLDFVDGRLQPKLDADNQLQLTPAAEAFRIVSEPWIYVVDRSGVIVGSFEGIATDAELRAAIDAARSSG